MPEYKKVGYLTTSFKMFHLKDTSRREFHYHYHDFHKILILLGGDVTYCIEGRTYQLAPGDIVLVNAGEVHKPEIHSDLPYERIILYVSPDFLTEYAGEDCDLSFCFKQAYREQAHILRLQDSKGGRLGASIRALDASLNDDDYAAALRHRLLFLEFMIQLNRAAMHDGIEFINDSASDEKIIAVPFHDPSRSCYFDISELPTHTMDEMQHFFEVYKSLEGKTTVVHEVLGHEDAERIIAECMENYDRTFGGEK